METLVEQPSNYLLPLQFGSVPLSFHLLFFYLLFVSVFQHKLHETSHAPDRADITNT